MSLEPLYRPEAIAAQCERLEGDIVLVTPRWFRVVAIALPLGVLASVFLLAIAPFPRVQEVSGWLTTSRGIIELRAPQTGTVNSLSASEGEFVRANRELATITVEHTASQLNATTEVATLRFVDQQLRQLKDRVDLINRRSQNEADRLTATLSALASQQAALDQQIARQQELIQDAKGDQSAGKELVQRGVLSIHLQRQRDSAVSEQERELASLSQVRASLELQVATTTKQLERAPIDAEEELARINGDIAQLEQHRTEIEGRRSYSVLAPVSGYVASVSTHIGTVVDERHALITLIPEGGKLEAEIYIPARSIAFVKIGQQVRLLYDAYPSARYGSQSATISSLTSAALSPDDVSGPTRATESMYVARVKLDGAAPVSAGKAVQLQPGMSLKATIVLADRSVYEWVLEPFFSVSTRS